MAEKNLPITGRGAEAHEARHEDLSALEYPRAVHKPGGAFLRVENATEARAAVADGWCIDANEALHDAPKAPHAPPVK
jgi:hypothetical protein